MRRRVFGVAVGVVGAGVWLLVAAVAFGIWRETEFNACGLTPPGRVQVGTGYHMRWDWTPPGWVCVYTDLQGRVVREERR